MSDFTFKRFVGAQLRKKVKLAHDGGNDNGAADCSSGAKLSRQTWANTALDEQDTKTNSRSHN